MISMPQERDWLSCGAFEGADWAGCADHKPLLSLEGHCQLQHAVPMMLMVLGVNAVRVLPRARHGCCSRLQRWAYPMSLQLQSPTLQGCDEGSYYCHWRQLLLPQLQGLLHQLQLQLHCYHGDDHGNSSCSGGHCPCCGVVHACGCCAF